MLTDRICARVASAQAVTTGYITHRCLAFQKRGQDGSAKADAMRTRHVSDRIWGVVFSLTDADKQVLNDFERGYDEERVIVFGKHGEFSASMYVAQADLIDAALKPYCWYHHCVVQGAVEHQLPAAYIQQLQSHRFVIDHDEDRKRRHAWTRA